MMDNDEFRGKEIPYGLMIGLAILFSVIITIIIITDYDRIVTQPNQLIEDFPVLKEILKIFNKPS